MPRPSSAINAGARAASNMKRIVGENIKARRIALDLSQEELAEKFGVSRTALSQYEIGVGEVNAGDLPRLARILGISTLDFYKQPDEAYLASYEAQYQSLAVLIRGMTDQKQAGRTPIKSFSPLAGIAPPELETPARSLDAVPQFQETTPPQFQALSELILQIAQLTEEDQETVRRMVSALQSARTLSVSKGPSRRAKRVAKRVSKKE